MRLILSNGVQKSGLLPVHVLSPVLSVFVPEYPAVVKLGFNYENTLSGNDKMIDLGTSGFRLQK